MATMQTQAVQPQRQCHTAPSLLSKTKAKLRQVPYQYDSYATTAHFLRSMLRLPGGYLVPLPPLPAEGTALTAVAAGLSRRPYDREYHQVSDKYLECEASEHSFPCQLKKQKEEIVKKEKPLS